jgi:hypothetical protein
MRLVTGGSGQLVARCRAAVPAVAPLLFTRLPWAMRETRGFARDVTPDSTQKINRRRRDSR